MKITDKLDYTLLSVSRLNAYNTIITNLLDDVSNKNDIQDKLQSLNYAIDNEIKTIKEKLNEIFKDTCILEKNINQQ